MFMNKFLIIPRRCCIICNLCLKNTCHSSCPNFVPKKSIFYCSVCGEGISEGEEYLINDDGEYRHYDCLCGMKDLLEWLGYEVKTMEDTYEKFY